MIKSWISRLITVFHLGKFPNMSKNNSNKKPILLFELGNLQVYHFQSPEEIARGDAPTTVYWQDKVSRHTYGGFPSIHAAMEHYTWTIATQKATSKDSGNVVYMDFKNKKRIIIGGTEST